MSKLLKNLGPPASPAEVDAAVLSAASRVAARRLDDGPSKMVQNSYSGESRQGQAPEPESEMSEPIVFPCPACGTKYSVAASHAGKKTKCKKCNAQITVPSPEVANPTLIGHTRTIRRSDIERSSSRKPTSKTVPSPAVDMTGGASVLRREETVLGGQNASPAFSGRARTPTRPQPSGASGRAPVPAPQGRMAPYQKSYGPRKKGNLPLILGISGGAVALILAVVLIVVATSKDSSGGGNSVAKTDEAVESAEQQRDRYLLTQMKNSINNTSSLTIEQVKHFYNQAKERSKDAEFNVMQRTWATELARKAESGQPRELADIAIMLTEDGLAQGDGLVRNAARAMEAAKIATKRGRVEGRHHVEADKTYEKLVKMLGWDNYTRPEMIEEYSEYDVDGFREYDLYYMGIDDVYRDTGLYPPEIVAKLKSLEAVAMQNGESAFKLHEADGFWKNARKAFLRFKTANDTSRVSDPSRVKWNRSKNQRSFCQIAMRRDNEAFEDVWTYTYWKPFIVYVEKPLGGHGRSAAFTESLDSKSALLQHLYNWFEENFITPFGLERVKPIGLGGRRPDGSQYESLGQQAAEEGWPLQIIVLKDEATFLQYCEDEMGAAIPGARAFYSPPNEVVITYDDHGDTSSDTAWFNEAVLIHETFHLLSDFYAAKPIDFKKYDLRGGQGPERPRYSSVLVQEGITDSVSGFVRSGGEGRDAKYEFLKLNHLRLRDWQNTYRRLNNKNVFRIQDMLSCAHYGDVDRVGVQRVADLGNPIPPNHARGMARGLYYAAACQASYFFTHYQENGKFPYKDKWWEFLKLDYTGKIDIKSYYDITPGIDTFKKVFGIKNDADWEALNKKFVDYTLNLTPENVGKGFEEPPPEDPAPEDTPSEDEEGTIGPAWRWIPDEEKEPVGGNAKR
jgi:hypothetical protein